MGIGMGGCTLFFQHGQCQAACPRRTHKSTIEATSKKSIRHPTRNPSPHTLSPSFPTTHIHACICTTEHVRMPSIHIHAGACGSSSSPGPANALCMCFCAGACDSSRAARETPDLELPAPHPLIWREDCPLFLKEMPGNNAAVRGRE